MNATEVRILASMKARTGTAREIAERIPACQRNVKALLNRFHANGQVHICHWRRGKSGPITPVYRLGPGTDVPKPAPLSTSTICSRYRARLRGKFGKNYGMVHAMQKKTIPGRKIIIDGQVAYQQ